MAAQDERELGDIAMGEGLLDPMAQDEEIEQVMLVVEEEQLIPPQMDPEPEKGTAAAAFDPPPLLRQNPSPAPGGSAPDNGELTAVGLADVRGMLDALMGAMRVNAQAMNEMNTNAQQMGNEIRGMNEKMDTNAQQMENKMDGNTNRMKEMRGEMRQVGQCLQAGIMAPPRAGTNELKGSAPAGEDKIIRETCWASSVRVTEEVTVTVREKLNGVTETCETRHEVTTTERIKCIETREMGTVEERLHGTDGVKEDAHTHTKVVEDNGGGLAERVETRCGQRGSLLRERRETLCSLEADRDQVGLVVPCEVEGTSAVDGCTPSVGGMETPGP